MMPPFPLLVWNEDKWTSDLILQSWAGFRLPKGNWNAVEVTKESNGTTKLIVEVPNGKPCPPSVEQTKAFQNLLDNEKAIGEQILQAIFDRYPEEKSAYGLDGEQADNTMPNIKQPEDLKQLIGLSKVYTLHEGHDNVPYIGFEFGCTWDSSHGLGVMTHDGRVMIVSDAEAANTAWIAEDSNKSA